MGPAAWSIPEVAESPELGGTQLRGTALRAVPG